jgi:hypothetical protein
VAFIDSYDIFETVLLRVVGDPTSLFLFVGQTAEKEGWLSCSPAAYRAQRIEAEREAYRRHAHPTFDNIFKALTDLLDLDSNQMDRLKQEELRLEEEWSRANPRFLQQIMNSRQQYGRVLFLSDMYLPKEFLQSNLHAKGLMEEGDILYLSNAENVGKSDGQLYNQVLKNEALNPHALRHHGNCPHADVNVARKMGVQTAPYPEGNLSLWERNLETYADQSDGLASLWAGASRRARCSLSFESNDTQKLTIRDTATSVAGPLLTTYVHWSLEQALADGVEILVFIARDGQVLHEIARVLQACEPAFQQLELRYIYGSRQAWRPASIVELGEFERTWILEGSNEITRKKILARTGLGEDHASKLPTGNNADALWDALEKQLREPLLKTAKDQRERVLKYLDQEGLLEGKQVGYVEIGCTGTTLAALEKILKSCGKPRPNTYFFGLSSGDLPIGPTHPSTYFYNENENRGIQASGDFNYFVLLEMFCAATHGRTTGYHHENGKIHPVLDSTQCYWQVAGSTELLQSGILAFAEAYADSPLLQSDPKQAIPIMAKVIRKFWQNPTPTEAKIWGSYRKEHDQSGFSAPEMARVHTKSDFLQCIRTQKLPPTWWPAATRLRTSLSSLWLLKTGIRLGSCLVQSRIALGRVKNRLLGRK